MHNRPNTLPEPQDDPISAAIAALYWLGGIAKGTAFMAAVLGVFWLLAVVTPS